MKNIDKEVAELFELYVTQNPGEVEDLQHLSHHIQESTDRVSKKNLIGHVTTSGLVVNSQEEVLLIFHKKLQKFLQPGGHVDDDSSLLNNAMREVFEETGIQVTPHELMRHESGSYIPIMIDSHRYPENVLKQQPEHWHHDYLFLFKTDDNTIHLQVEEVTEYKWVSLDEKQTDKELVRAFEKLQKLLLSDLYVHS